MSGPQPQATWNAQAPASAWEGHWAQLPAVHSSKDQTVVALWLGLVVTSMEP